MTTIDILLIIMAAIGISIVLDRAITKAITRWRERDDNSMG